MVLVKPIAKAWQLVVTNTLRMFAIVPLASLLIMAIALTSTSVQLELRSVLEVRLVLTLLVRTNAPASLGIKWTQLAIVAISMNAF